jgi:hypothetical protein
VGFEPRAEIPSEVEEPQSFWNSHPSKSAKGGPPAKVATVLKWESIHKTSVLARLLYESFPI